MMRRSRPSLDANVRSHTDDSSLPLPSEFSRQRFGTPQVGSPRLQLSYAWNTAASCIRAILRAPAASFGLLDEKGLFYG